MRLTVLLCLTLLLAAGCGSDPRNQADQGPAPKFEPIRMSGPIPGSRVDGRFVDEEGRTVSDVHELHAAGTGRHRASLLFGRQDGVPCIGAAAPNAEPRLHCLERWENPPFFSRVVLGGDRGARTDWFAVVGVLRRPAAAVSMQPQSGMALRLELRTWPKFDWRAFAVTTDRGNFANTLSVTDKAGTPVTSVEVSWAYDAAQSSGAWAEVRDPIAAASGADLTSHPIVFEHPSVRRLAVGHTFTINATSGWQACDGRSLGAVVSFRFSPPVDFKGEIPFHDYAGDDENVAYREGRAYVEAERITTVDAWVDLNRRRVVGIDLEALDPTDLEQDEASADIGRRDVLEEPKPAGGPDDADACPKHEFGD